MTGSPATVLARWPSANAQSAVPLIARTITFNLNGIASGRRAIQIRPFRMPASGNGTGQDGNTKTGLKGHDSTGKAAKGVPEVAKKEEGGRNLYVVRSLSVNEQMMVFVEDPAAPTSSVYFNEQHNTSENGKSTTESPHNRWTYCTLGVTGLLMSTNPPPGTITAPFDAFLQRVLLGGSGNLANAPVGGNWLLRNTAISIEGFVFSSGAPGGSVCDWEIKVGTVMVKGGVAGGTSRGVLIEVTYMAVPYLPAGSTYVKDFLLSLIPAQAVSAGEINLIQVPNNEFYGAGLLEPPDPGKGEEAGEWEWTNKHSAFAYLHTLRQEGLL